jgi:hypothetical protein
MQKIGSILIIIVLLSACESKKEEKNFEKSYETVKETLAEKEKNNPKRFLMVTNRDRKNLIGQTVVMGSIWMKDWKRFMKILGRVKQSNLKPNISHLRERIVLPFPLIKRSAIFQGLSSY